MVANSRLVTQEQTVQVARILKENDFGPKTRDVVADTATLEAIKEVIMPPDKSQSTPLSEKEVAQVHAIFVEVGLGTEISIQLSDPDLWGEIRGILFPRPSGNT